MRKTLVNALLLPHVNYCAAVYLGIGSGLNLKLQRLVNEGIRYTLGLPWDSPITQARINLGWPTVSMARARAVLIIVRKALIERAPSYLTELLAVYSATRLFRNQTSSNRLVIPNHHTQAYKYSFAVAAPYLWNDLPDELRSVRSASTFKRDLGSWLLKTDESWAMKFFVT
ncbi:uncharacterized protein LOC130667336 [Microplitis mediator]|uniref:uncharacterized protein LOC130667336 n=1 Tax=Microplitis mediator TaxID=375433 RepID=UPI0025564A7D|nr:uncharacterized protein LOC130667336 [Microplitis mediator]